MLGLWFICIFIFLLCISMLLVLKLYLLRNDLKNLYIDFTNNLENNTNNLLTISTRDPYLRKWAIKINSQLKLLHKERHCYQQGDLELKESITNISHDLRTPLTAINGYLDLLEEEEKSEIVRHYLIQIQNRTNFLNNIIEELFQYSIVKSSKELNFECVNIVQILEENLLSFYGVMQKKDIHPQIELPDEPIFCNLDKDAVNRIFSNIISNALKYSDGDLFVTMKENGSIIFTNTAHNLNVFKVKMLFERFYTIEDRHNSTGLGLSIAKSLVERMGGSIEAYYNNEKLEIKIKF